MTMAMSMTAFAADATTYTLTLTGTTTGHTYEAYQIFTGNLSGTTLSNIEWGTGVKDTDKLVAALKADNTLKATFGSVTDAASVAEALSAAKDDAVARAFATVVSQYLSDTKTSKDSTATSTEITGLSAGYYLVKDKDNSIDSTKKDAYTRFILQVVGNTSVAVKSDVPTVEKKVKDTNDSDGTTTGWQDSADYDIGDSVPYQITGTMPSNIADYTTYKYVFTDTMSAGLTYTAGTAKIKIYSNAADVEDETKGTDVTSAFTEEVNGQTVTWTCDDLIKKTGIKLTADTKVVVTYNATLNDNAVIGAAGNPNTVDLTYSNNPNKGGEGDTGKTPKDTNIVFTYKTIVNKVDQDGKTPLAGADFTLQKKTLKKGQDGNPVKDDKGNSVYEYTNVKKLTVVDAQTTRFEFSGLDDGEYRLTETTTPAGYNTIDPVEFTITATHEETSEAVPKLLTLSGGDKKTGGVTFSAGKAEDGSLDGSLTTNIVNKKGSVLPSTGGVGTHMFYVFGGCLVAAAVVLLALKKRKEA